VSRTLGGASPKVLVIALLASPACDLSGATMAWLSGGSDPFAAFAQAAKGQQSQSPDLGVSILRSGSDDRPLIVPGQTITLSVGVNNLRGSEAAHSSTLTVTLPAGVTLHNANQPPDRVDAGSSLVWNLGTLDAGAFPRLFELDLALPANASAGSPLSVSAHVATSDPEANLKNNDDTFTMLVQSAAVDLNVESNLDAVPLTVTAPVTFMATVNNLGTVAAPASALTITLPAGVSFQSADPAPSATTGTAVSWQLGNIEAGGSRSVSVSVAVGGLPTVELDSTARPAGPLRFLLEASTSASDANRADNRLEVDKRVERAGPDLKIWLNVEGAGEAGPPPTGSDLTYVIAYGNFGNQVAPRVSVTLSLGTGFSLSRAQPAPTGTQASDRFAGGVLSWDVGDLQVGQSSAIRCVVRAAAATEEESLVMAAIAGPGTSATAYSFRHGPTGGIPKGSAKAFPSRLTVILVLALVSFAVLVIMRARRKR